MKRLFFGGFMAAALMLVGTAALAADLLASPYQATIAVKQYEAKLKEAGVSPDELEVFSIGQSHIDAAWKWRLSQTHTKVYNTYGQAAEHMDEYPDFRFSGSSPQYYEWLLDEHPEVFQKIVEKEAKGQWEIVGGMWVEPDGNMPDGESFTRQRLLGQLFYKEHFGHISEVSWLLDSFGYNLNYPQIVSKSGAKYMWTNKLTWNDTTIFPFHHFRWRSPDGSEVLTYICQHSPMPMYFPYSELGKYRDTRRMLKPGAELVANYSTPKHVIDEAMSQDLVNVIGVFYGLGDGGLGPREIEIRVQEGLAREGYVKPGSGLELFQAMEKCKDRMPVWNDEMYLEFHRGVLTTQAWIKRANREAEQKARSAETIRSMLQVMGVKYPYEGLKKIWKLILLNQFHDILPGSSIPEVYQDARPHYKLINDTLDDVTFGGLRELSEMIKTNPPSKDMDSILVFNSLGWDRDGLVRLEVPSGKSYKVVDKNGGAVKSQELEREGVTYLVFRAKDVPSVGYKTYYAKEVEAPATGEGPAISEDGEGFTMENEFVKVFIDKKQGWIRSLVNKETGNEYIREGANKIGAYYDKPAAYSAWNIDKDYLKHPFDIPEASRVEVTSRGPLWSEILLAREIVTDGRRTTFEQRVRLVEGDPVVYLDLDSDFHMWDTLVKVEFDTVLHSNTVAADGPYLVVERPTHPQTEAEKARWEMPCHKWIDLSTGEGGLALLNNGKYGFSLNEWGTGYRLSVIKGARYPRANPEARDVKHHYYSWPIPTGYTDQGAQHAEMGLLAHKGGWREAKLWEAGYNFNAPMEAIWTTDGGTKLGERGSFLTVNSKSVYLGSVKRAEEDGDLVIRLVEAAGKGDTAVLHFGEGFQATEASSTDLLEMHPETIPIEDGAMLRVGVKPYEIKTVKLKMNMIDM